jgi:dihydroflavonol-4-reductase
LLPTNKNDRETHNILVTGASGFIGRNLVPRLVELGHNVNTFGRTKILPASISRFNLNHYCGDITDYQAVADAVQNMDIVFHLAGLVSYRKKDLDKIYTINVTGTSNVMQACLDYKIKRVIHTSSVAAMGIPPAGTIGNETIDYNLSNLGLSYCDTKHLGEQEVMKRVKRGLPAVILNPGIIFGEGDTHPHHHAIFAAMSKGRMLGVPPGGIPFSDINDVVDAHINCIQEGKIGERYVLVNANLSFKDASRLFASIYNVRAALFEIPGPLLVSLGNLVEKISPLFGIDPPVTRQGAWLTQHKIFFSSSKAQNEIDFQPTPFAETIRRTSSYYLGNANKPMHSSKKTA